ncbi:MAG: hypothetical protein ACRBC3_07615 [Burkholderiaceae bacterium]
MAKLSTLLRPAQLLLPALLPAWNFFDWIAPSPRIEYRLSTSPGEECHWLEFRPRPERLTLTAIASRLFFNARWNETLFLVSCAERLHEYPTEHSIDQIFRRLAADMPASPAGTTLQFRVVFVSRNGNSIAHDIDFVSDPMPLSEITAG